MKHHHYLLAAAIAAACSQPALADTPGCFGSTIGKLTASAPAITAGQPVTLRWEVLQTSAASGCSTRTQSITGIGPVAASGSLTVTPRSTTEWTLKATQFSGTKTLGSARVGVVSPPPLSSNGRPYFRIDNDAQQDLFIAAVATPNADVVLADDLNLDLSGREEILIARGVHILGGRSSSKPGPRLFSRTVDVSENSHVFFRLAYGSDGDNVRISGIRLDGGVMDVRGEQEGPGQSGWMAISLTSNINVEIDNNEIYGWPGRGVHVADDAGDRIGLANATAVRVHDNFIHHIRHWRREGYGIQANSGAYVLIERNVLDYNRHAIEASGASGTGYLAYGNLLLGNGGEGIDLIFGTDYTHQIDVHGTDGSLTGGDASGGQAGEYFDIRNNSSLYAKTTTVKVRGEPTVRADVAQNTFVTPRNQLGGPQPFATIVQNEGTNLISTDNRFDVAPTKLAAVCDFDGDGTLDDFMATGASWWFMGATRQWNPLQTSTRMADELMFYDYSGDGQCDIKVPAESVFYRSGRGPAQLIPVLRTEVTTRRSDLVWVPGAGGNGRARVQRLSTMRNAVEIDVSINGPTASSRLLGTGDFNADGSGDLLWRDVAGEVYETLLDENLSVLEGLGSRLSSKGKAPGLVFDGIGDFNGDGRSDVLWHDAAGRYLIWFAAESGNGVYMDSYTKSMGSGWTVQSVGDFDGNGRDDILWRDGIGVTTIQHDGGYGSTDNSGASDNTWIVQGSGRFDDNGKSDILWRSRDGVTGIWTDSGTTKSPGALENTWQMRGIADFDADGRSDILWRRDTGAALIWLMANGAIKRRQDIPSLGAEWALQGVLTQGMQKVGLQAAVMAQHNVNPTARMASVVDHGSRTVTFLSSGSSDSDGTIVSRRWEFGDGTGSQLVSPAKTYSRFGTYPVNLTVVDDAGGDATATQNVELRDPCGCAELQSGVPVTANRRAVRGRVSTVVLARFSFYVPSGAKSATFGFGNSRLGNSGELYVRAGATPTAANYQCRSERPETNGTCTVTNPTPGYWYLEVVPAGATPAYAAPPPGEGDIAPEQLPSLTVDISASYVP